MVANTIPSRQRRVATGIAGLDDILNGGLPENRLYLIQGDPGVGKTTLALQYLLEGAKNGERGLYITLSETQEELRAVADSHAWNLSSLSLFELTAAEQSLKSTEHNTLFHPSEIELTETMEALLAQVEKTQPARVVFDSLSELRLLAQSPLRYRRQILSLKQYFSGKRCTVLLLDDGTSTDGDLQVQSLAHGVLTLQQLAPEFGGDRRRLRVVKLRGAQFRSGYHDYVIEPGGLRVFPRLIAAEHPDRGENQIIPSGLTQLDALLGGGVHRGTSMLLMGPAGSGKTSLAVQYAAEAVRRGEKAALYLFDERTETLMQRAQGMGISLRHAVDSKAISLTQVHPAELSPGEFADRVRQSVERDNARVVVIDSLNGYLNAMPEERFLIIQMHELLTYLGQHGVLTILIVAEHGLIGATQSPIDVSYLSDTALLLRFFEAAGEVRQALSVLKKRTGGHERAIRELRMSNKGIAIGEPLREFQGVLSGVPAYLGKAEVLASRDAGKNE